MKDVAKRIVILMAFGAGFAVLLLMLNVRGGPETARPSSKPDSVRPVIENEPPERKPSPLPLTEIEAQTIERRTLKDETPTPAEEPESLRELKELFSSGKADGTDDIDWNEVEGLLQEHVDRNHPGLKLSDSDYERLSDSMKSFREANEKMRSLERTPANAPAIRQSLQDLDAAMKAFDELTGMSPGEFFMEEDAPVIFGGDPLSRETDDEIVTEYLDPRR
jgi:hypothetical protein